MKENNLLGIDIQYHTKNEILENIKKNMGSVDDFFHIVSLNGEIMTLSVHNNEFYKVLSQSSIRIVDGASVALGCSILNITYGERIPGADLMEDLLSVAGERGSRVLFLGGREDLAKRMVDCYRNKYPKASFRGLQGFEDILAPQQAEYREICGILDHFKPDLVLAAFGSPYQELFFYRHRASFSKCICMGVGGGFDFAIFC
jgi:N-acetylglucosaminyldiphosphoundecaprenol N-acetyl-beta-D-mannosaminyltransferase